MVQGNANLIIDLGNSSTKCIVQFGKDAQTGKFRERRFDIPNVFAPISQDYEVSSDYNDATSTILYVDTTLNDKVIKGYFCNGELQEKEKPLSTIKPSATSKKYDLDSTVLSYNLAFLFAFKAIMNMQRISDYSQLDITWNIVTLLPPGDIDAGREPIKNILFNIKEINSIYPECKIPVNINRVTVLPEGFCAYAAVVYDKGIVYREENKFLVEETVLVFDIGAGTTDCLLIKNNKLVQNSKYTVTQGGNNVYQYVRRKLKTKGLDLDDADIRAGVVTGVVKDGSKEIDIADIINDAKEEIATKIISEFQDYIEVTDIKLRSIGYVLVCGGGSMNNESENIMALSDKVIERFKQLSPNSGRVEIPYHTVTKELADGDLKKVEERISPRDLNLLGASILAEKC